MLLESFAPIFYCYNVLAIAVRYVLLDPKVNIIYCYKQYPCILHSVSEMNLQQWMEYNMPCIQTFSWNV